MQIVWPNPFHKIKHLWYCMALLTCIIVTRLFYLQITQAALFTAQGTKNFLRIERIPCPRGNIIDSKGLFLATNRPTIDVYWQGTGNSNLTADQQQTLSKLEKIINIPISADEPLIKTISKGEKQYKTVFLACDISFEQLSKLEEQLTNKANIVLRSNFKRFYPYQTYASHIVGYLGTFNLKPMGKMGLEQLLETQLQGEQGIRLKTINSLGRHLEQHEVKQSLAGQNIQVTIDIELQRMIEEVFPQEYTGTFILMDPLDGSLVALVSRPNFDPAVFLEHIKTESWQQLQEKQPFLNRAFNACYPPGSIFKLVTTSAALEHNIINPDDSWYCKGYVTFANRQYFCHNREGHGRLSAQKGLANSCNTMFFELAKKMDIDLIADYAHRFGLGQPTNIIFPEKIGIVPSRKWKLANKGERWWPGETLSAVIGQSFLLVTPIQVARMISSIFTGYLVTPRILINEPVIKQPIKIANSTRAFLRNSMQLVVKEGTGQRVNRIKDIEIYAKTSTAQTSAYNKRTLGSLYQEHAWFVAHFNYKENRSLTFVILIEHAGSSRVATEVAKRFLIEYKKLIDRQERMS